MNANLHGSATVTRPDTASLRHRFCTNTISRASTLCHGTTTPESVIMTRPTAFGFGIPFGASLSVTAAMFALASQSRADQPALVAQG